MIWITDGVRIRMLKTTTSPSHQPPTPCARLVATFRKIGIEAETYTTNNPQVIFDLMQIPESDPVMQAYFKMIEAGGDIETQSEYPYPIRHHFILRKKRRIG